MVIPNQEENRDAANTCPKIYFHVYRNVSCCKIYGRCPYEEGTTCSMCSTMLRNYTTAKLYTWKDIVLIDTLIREFNNNFYILEIQKLEFYLPHVCIFGTHHCGK